MPVGRSIRALRQVRQHILLFLFFEFFLAAVRGVSICTLRLHSMLHKKNSKNAWCKSNTILEHDTRVWREPSVGIALRRSVQFDFLLAVKILIVAPSCPRTSAWRNVSCSWTSRWPPEGTPTPLRTSLLSNTVRLSSNSEGLPRYGSIPNTKLRKKEEEKKERNRNIY